MPSNITKVRYFGLHLLSIHMRNEKGKNANQLYARDDIQLFEKLTNHHYVSTNKVSIKCPHLEFHINCFIIVPNTQ